MARNVWFRYKNAGTPTDLRLYCSIYNVKTNAERSVQRALDGTDYDLLLSKRNVYAVEVGADQLQVPANADYMAAYWSAEQRLISLTDSDTTPIDADFFGVTTGDGDAPISYLQGIVGLPEYTFTLIEKSPSL